MNEYTRHPNTACHICGKSIYRRPAEIKKSRGGLFCGQACYGRSMRKEHPCIVCKIPILAGANKKTCSRGCANKHRTNIKYNIGSPRDKVKDQRSIKIRLLKNRGGRCERCGFDICGILQTHHQDRNRNNNELNNLELLCPNCHAKEHNIK